VEFNFPHPFSYLKNNAPVQTDSSQLEVQIGEMGWITLWKLFSFSITFRASL